MAKRWYFSTSVKNDAMPPINEYMCSPRMMQLGSSLASPGIIYSDNCWNQQYIVYQMIIIPYHF